MSIKIKSFFLGAVLGVFISLIPKYVIINLGDAKIDMDYAGLRVLSEKLILYKKLCGKYPASEIGLKALTSKFAEDCYPLSERIEEVPLAEDDQEIIYLLQGEDFYLISPGLGHKSVISSRSLR